MNEDYYIDDLYDYRDDMWADMRDSTYDYDNYDLDSDFDNLNDNEYPQEDV